MASPRFRLYKFRIFSKFYGLNESEIDCQNFICVEKNKGDPIWVWVWVGGKTSSQDIQLKFHFGSSSVDANNLRIKSFHINTIYEIH